MIPQNHPLDSLKTQSFITVPYVGWRRVRRDLKMKFKKDRPLVNPETAIEKLLKIANGIEADHAGRIAVAFRAVPHFGEG